MLKGPLSVEMAISRTKKIVKIMTDITLAVNSWTLKLATFGGGICLFRQGQKQKKKKAKINYIKLKNFCTVKENINKMVPKLQFQMITL